MSRVRVQIMNQFERKSHEYKAIKRYWKLIQQDSRKLSDKRFYRSEHQKRKDEFRPFSSLAFLQPTIVDKEPLSYLILLLLTWQGYVVCPHQGHGGALRSRQPIALARPLRLVRGKGVRS